MVIDAPLLRILLILVQWRQSGDADREGCWLMDPYLLLRR